VRRFPFASTPPADSAEAAGAVSGRPLGGAPRPTDALYVAFFDYSPLFFEFRFVSIKVNGKVFPVSETVGRPPANTGSALMAKLSPAASSSPRRLAVRRRRRPQAVRAAWRAHAAA
jgi:hypothetical protein